MRILMLNYEFPPLGGGGGVVTRDLSIELVRQGHLVDVVTASYKNLPRQEEVNGVIVHRVPSLRSRPNKSSILEMASYLFGAKKTLLRLTGQNHYDVVHCHFLLPTGLLGTFLKRRLGLPFVVTAHGSDVPGHNRERFVLAHKFTRPFLRKIIKEASSVTAPSNFLKSLIEKNIGPFDVTAIPNGVSEDFLDPSPEKNIILMTGRLVRFKGFQYVLKALQGIDCDLEVHIAGDGPMMGELKGLASQLNMPVTFHGWLKNDSQEMRRLYEQALIYCLPSGNENASVALLEAMLAGAAVMTSTSGGCPETVGDCGVLVEPGNVGQMSEVILGWRNYRESALSLGARARQRVLDNFTWPKIAADYIKIYEKAVAAEVQHA